MNREKNLKILGGDNSFELDGDAGCDEKERFNRFSKIGVRDVSFAGRSVPLAKQLLTNSCDNNCAYCAFGRERDIPRATWKPEKLAVTIDEMTRSGLINGLLLSSGLAGNSVGMMSKMLDTATILRRKGYRNYIHLKILPGAEDAQVEAAMQIADRASINLEAPTVKALAKIAPEKTLPQDLVSRLRKAADYRRSRPWLKTSLSTQFVVGPGGESDGDLLTAASRLAKGFGLARVYFSGFSPLAGTPLEHHPRCEKLRVARLYQAEWLLRVYGFEIDEMPLDDNGRLPDIDNPKQAWAQKHPEFFPIEINSADYKHLIRVPGIGPTGARRIITLRMQERIHRIEQLSKLRVRSGQAAPYILLSGKSALPRIQLAFNF